MVIAGLTLAQTHAQTCCSGGVPVSSNIGFRPDSSGVIQLSYSSDYRVLTTLKSGSETLDDDLRKRTTWTHLARVGYQLLPGLSLEAMVPLVTQTRNIESGRGTVDVNRTFGLGDPLVLLLYEKSTPELSLRPGLGVMIPLGSTDEVDDRGLTLLEDLQPGRGAWNLVPSLFVDKSISRRPQGSLFLYAIATLTGTNDDTRGGFQSYTFGDDLQLILGYGEQVYLSGLLMNPGASVRYRAAGQDKVDESLVPGTGGSFVFGRLHNDFILTPSLTLGLRVEAPLYSRVNDTQLVPTWGGTFTLNYKLYTKDQLITF